MRPASNSSAPALVAGALLLALVAGCTASVPAGEVIPGVRVGVTLPASVDRPTAPVDTAMSLVDPARGDGVGLPELADDAELSLADFAGQVVVLNFWASWCAPCRDEQPDLNEAYRLLVDRPVVFLGVNIDDTVPNARAHEREFAMPYPSLFDPSLTYAASFKGVGPRSIPTTIIIDAEGRVAARFFGLTTKIEVLAMAERVAQEVG